MARACTANRAFLALCLAGLVAASCASDANDIHRSETSVAGGPEPTTVAEVAPPDTSVTTSNVEEPDDVPATEVPADVLFLPSELPDGWAIRTVRTFPRLEFGAPDGGQRTYVAHRTEGGYGVGGAAVTVTEHANAAAAAAATAVGQLGLETTLVAVNGFGEGATEDDPDQSGLSTLAVARETISVSLIGSIPVADLIDIAESLRLTSGENSGNGPTAELALTGWVLDDAGSESGQYEIDIDRGGPVLSVHVTPGTTRSSLYLRGDDFVSVLIGSVGEGYYAVQRVEAEGLEFPRIAWWVPDVLLTAFPTDDPALIAGLLDSFIEVDDATFLEMTKDATFVEVELQEDTPTPAEPGPDSSRPFDETRLNLLASFIEGYVGRSFDTPPEVDFIDRGTFTDAVSPGTFITEAHWNLYQAVGLVSADDDRLEAEAVRIEEIRGVCCPVQLIEQPDPDFNEVVIVHELTHGLDSELNTGASGNNEPLDTTRALVEGNAHRVAFAYADLLEDGGASLPDPPAVFTNVDDPRLPDAIRELLEFPYDEGRLFAAALVDAGGEQSIVDAFADPPTTSEQILDPEAYLSGERGASVDGPDPADGSSPLSTGSIGAFTLRLLLERSMDSDAAHALALSWSGDRYSLYGDAGAPCIVATIVMDDESSAESVADALRNNPLDGVDNDVQRDGTSISLLRCADA